jgi:CHAT domain-containing protein
LIWQPIDSVLSGVKTIYYSPTGALYSIPFHAIYPAKGQGDHAIPSKKQKRGVVESEDVITEPKAEYLMDRYTLHQLTSTRYLAMGLKSKAKVPIGNELALVGGVNYDYLKGSSKYHASKDPLSARRGESQAMRLTFLKGTKLEVEQIHQQAISANWKSTVYQKDEATEERVMQWEGKNAVPILHLATHGFTFPVYEFNAPTISHQSLRYQYRYSTNPMVRCGLLLSGGNWAWMGSDTLSRLGAEQNGILTALEISQLNLKNTQLVVLSACETGLGKVDRSEGTFGLKRGFKLAGVEQLIVSLWPVPDKETMELMTLFYADLMQTQLPVVSFEKAQRAMRQKYPNEPDKWAGFVLVR